MRFQWIAGIIFLTGCLTAQTSSPSSYKKNVSDSKKISVSPEGNIWVSATFGKTSYLGKDSSWHLSNFSFEEPYQKELTDQQFKEIAFFNSDTVIMIGDINVSGEPNSEKKGVYLSVNKGRNWELIDLGQGSVMNDIFIGAHGKAWMGGKSGEIYYSEDYGHHWKKLNSPYNSSSELNTIYMRSDVEGISGSSDNSIHLTSDNWTTVQKIETPHDELKHIMAGESARDKVEKIRLWKDYYVINQGGHIYYSLVQKIDWQSFPIGLADFEVDRISGKLYAVGKNLKAIYFSTPFDYEYLNKTRLKKYPADMDVCKDTIYVLDTDNNVYRVGAKEYRILPALNSLSEE